MQVHWCMAVLYTGTILVVYKKQQFKTFETATQNLNLFHVTSNFISYFYYYFNYFIIFIFNFY